ncbi:MAG: leucine-rich repeat domain-containing protein [Promethearchaeota archaeon]
MTNTISTDGIKKFEKINLNDFKNVDWGNAINQIKGILFKNCNIQSFEGIENLENLESLEFYEYIGINTIGKLNGLSNLPKLRKLALTNTGISNLNGLENLPKLEQLELNKNNFTKIPKLDIFPNLKELSISRNQISIIEGLDNLNLTKLSLKSNIIAEIEGLNRCVSLKILSLRDNKIKKIENLEACINLANLNLSRNIISIIEGLDTLKNLKILSLAGNKISKIGGIDKIENLTKIELYDNQISKIEGIKHLKKLEEFRISKNQITDINDLMSLVPSNIKIIKLDNNQIQDASVLWNFPPETKVSIEDNPITIYKDQNGLKVSMLVSCLYCNATTLDKKEECSKKLHNLVYNYIGKVPILLKGKRYTVETGEYFSDRTKRYEKTVAGMRDTVFLKDSERFGGDDIKKLNGPLCENCMNLYLKESEEIVKKLSMSDKAAKIISSTKKARVKSNQNWLKWQKKIRK